MCGDGAQLCDLGPPGENNAMAHKILHRGPQPLGWGLVPTIRSVAASDQKQNESESHSVMSNSLQPHGLYGPWNSLGKNTGVSSRSLLQGIFPTQGSNPGLPHCRQILYQLSHQGSPILRQLIANIVCGERITSRGKDAFFLHPEVWRYTCSSVYEIIVQRYTGTR